ncbi:hypothetical protein TRFO_39308 [Tritrichomonas foetus]|uniref:Uncharacterized protein n=1 Tax=Tritrichomonas foetus TaxID=1144522 RepID=A0A1J4J5K4_9EUKA|nr:hypothetical protein TRFO_39308 [Tritrichomonas foetus]|eukprot:OHS94536.1 hypothetical protein TRFO_39308 [Tritrichomonas foetus]
MKNKNVNHSIMKENLAFMIIKFITSLIGGVFFTFISIISVLCTLNALLSLSDENRIVFKRFAHAIGIIVALFGILLPFRGINPVPTLLSLWWTAFFFEYYFFTKFPQIQVFLLSVLSISFWVYYMNTEGVELFFMLKIGDFMIFVIAPIVVGLVMIARGSNNLIDQTQPKFPLRAFLAKMAILFKSAFPAK